LNWSFNLCSTINNIHSLGYKLWLYHIFDIPQSSKILLIKDNHLHSNP
jgi:hypothetical protein